MPTTKDELRKQIGQNIRQRRLELNITQEELAAKVGYSHEHCVQVENGNKGLSIQSLQQMAEALNVSTDYLIYGRTERTEFASIIRLLDSLPLRQLHRLEQAIELYVETWHDNSAGT